MSKKQFKIVGIGEILWDCLPDGKQLGGAPANFAYVSNQLGHQGLILSRIGQDKLGQAILDELKTKKLSTDFIQADAKYPTGSVNVLLENGQPSYKIVEKVAWDFLALSEDWQELAKTCDAVCFGTLAQRNSVSEKTIQEFVDLTTSLRILDLNLRQRYFSGKVLLDSLRLADVVKLNDEELPVIVKLLEIVGTSIVSCLQNLVEKFHLKLICLTRGAKGSLLVNKDEVSENQGLKIEVADTVGAGDAFTATLTHGILQNWDLDKINQKANQIGAFVASKTGAMPDFTGFEL
jgi:fructokinase